MQRAFYFSKIKCLKSLFNFSLSLNVSLFFRDNGLKAIENLMVKKGKFDYILLETTGLADPGIAYFAELKSDHIDIELISFQLPYISDTDL